jgi:hypothetical protein
VLVHDTDKPKFQETLQQKLQEKEDKHNFAAREDK